MKRRGAKHAEEEAKEKGNVSTQVTRPLPSLCMWPIRWKSPAIRQSQIHPPCRVVGSAYRSAGRPRRQRGWLLVMWAWSLASGLQAAAVRDRSLGRYCNSFRIGSSAALHAFKTAPPRNRFVSKSVATHGTALRARRNPTLTSWHSPQSRCATRQNSAPTAQWPSRNTRAGPVAGPRGSDAGEEA